MKSTNNITHEVLQNLSPIFVLQSSSVMITFNFNQELRSLPSAQIPNFQ